MKHREDFQKVEWRRLVCNNIGSPRWIFILRLTALHTLYIRDRLLKWGMVVDPSFRLCTMADEATLTSYLLAQYLLMCGRNFFTGLEYLGCLESGTLNYHGLQHMLRKRVVEKFTGCYLLLPFTICGWKGLKEH